MSTLPAPLYKINTHRRSSIGASTSQDAKFSSIPRRSSIGLHIENASKYNTNEKSSMKCPNKFPLPEDDNMERTTVNTGFLSKTKTRNKKCVSKAKGFEIRDVDATETTIDLSESSIEPFVPLSLEMIKKQSVRGLDYANSEK